MNARRAALGRAVLWVLAAWLLTFPNLSRFGSHIIGDRGDALFNLATLRYGAESLRHGFRHYWAGFSFAGAHLPMAYSDTQLGIVPVFAVLDAVTGSAIIALNLLWVASWVAAAELTFRLARRLSGSVPASLVAALAFTYSTIRLGQFMHFQLAMGAFIPAVVLATLCLLDRPVWWRGVVLGGLWATCTLSSSYYGIALAVVIGTLVVVHATRGRTARAALPALAVAAVVAGVLMGPAALKYLDLQRDPAFRRTYEPDFAARVSDLAAPSPATRFLGGMPLLDHRARSSERPAYVGLIPLAAGGAGLVLLARRRRWLAAELPPRRRELAGIVVSGAVLGVVALGHNVGIGSVHLPALYSLFAKVVPGFKGMRALVRLLVFGQLALCLCAAVGLAALARRRPHRLTIAVTAIAIPFVLFEASVHLYDTRVPTVAANGAANRWLEHQPAGRVLELPIPDPSANGAVWAFVEAGRGLLATYDGHPRINGYSGFWSPGYPALAKTLDGLPAPAAVAELATQHVHYLLIHTREIPSNEGLDEFVTASGEAFMPVERAHTLIAGLPAGTVATVTDLDGAVVVTLND